MTVPHADVGRLENDLRSGQTVPGVEYADAATVLLAVDPEPAFAAAAGRAHRWYDDVVGAREEWVDH